MLQRSFNRYVVCLEQRRVGDIWVASRKVSDGCLQVVLGLVQW